MPLEKPAGSHTGNTFKIWRSRNHNDRKNLSGRKLANVRRGIINKKRLTDFELRKMKEKVIAHVNNIDFGNAGIRDGGVDGRDEGTGGLSCADPDTRIASTRHVDQRENLNHIEALNDIPIGNRSADELELVGKGNHYVSYGTTDNSTIMPHLSVNENSKTNSNPKRRKIDRNGKENNDANYTSFRNEIIETIEKTEAISMI